jgi:transposase
MMYYEWMTYSLDLRKKALKYLDKVGDRKKVAEAFGITLRTLANWIRKKKENCLAPKPRRCSPSLIDSQKLQSFIQEHPDAYLREIAKEFGATLQAVFYACKRLKISLKKRHRIIRNVTKRKEKSLSKKSKRSRRKIESISMKVESIDI